MKVSHKEEDKLTISRRPDITDEEIGMRTFQLRKEKAQERALEKIRQGLKADWVNLSVPEIDLLGWVLGEVWAYIARREWEHLAFSALNTEKVRKILKIANEIVSHKKVGTSGLEEVYNLITGETK